MTECQGKKDFQNLQESAADFFPDQMVVMFYMDGDSASKSVGPIFSKVGKSFDKALNFVGVSCARHRDVCNKEEIRQYPTFKFYGPRENRKTFSGSPSVKSLGMYSIFGNAECIVQYL